jgi:hypothetical protein
MRYRRLLPSLCFALLAAGLLAATPAAQDPPAHEVVRVTNAAALFPCEVSVAVNPTNPDHLIAVSMQNGLKGKPPISDCAYVSTDGGKTWKTVVLANPDQRLQGDDVVAFGPDGVAYHACISFMGIRELRPARAVNGIFVSSSRDGITWSNPVAVIDHINSVTPFEDKPMLGVDLSADSPYRGQLYVAWTKFDEYGSKKPEHKTHIFFSRSKDGGKSFSVPLQISDKHGDCLDSDNTVMGAVPAVGPKGEVYVAWAGPEGIVIDRSLDGGWTFGKDVLVSKTPGGWDIPIKGMMRANGLPSVGVDLSKGRDRGSVYVNWVDERHGDPDVFVAASRDGGATWGEPLRVNDDQKGNGKEQFFTWMAVDPSDGSVNVVFYDRRDQNGTSTTLTLARSIDGGRTFVNYRIKQEPFVCQNNAFFGDYLGIAAHSGRVTPVYQHFTGKGGLALSAAVFRFRPGTQEVVKGEK